jgi:hypothetical protein
MDIPVELRMERVLQLQTPRADLPEWESPTLRQRVAAHGGSLTVVMERVVVERDMDVFDADPFMDQEPRDMDWEDDEPIDGDRRRRWFLR